MDTVAIFTLEQGRKLWEDYNARQKLQPDAGTFTPEQAHQLWQDYQTRQQLQPHISQNFPQRREINEVSPHRAFVKNTETEEIPAYACMQVTGVEDVAGRTTITVSKPTTLDGQYLFNSQFAIPAESATTSGVGWAYRYGLVVMLGDTPTTPGESYQPIVASWEVEAGGSGFVVYGRHNANDRALIGRITSSGGSGEYFWFTVDSLVCPGDDPYAFPDGGLIVTVTYSSDGGTPVGAETDGTYHVYDYIGILEYSVDTKDNIAGSKGRCSYGAAVGSSAFQWILDSINSNPSCA